MANEDIEQKIKITVDTNANEASKEVNELSGSIERAETSQIRAVKTTKEAGEAHKAAAKGAKGQAEAIESLGGPMGQAVSGMKAMLKQMWLMVANPIVLTIVAIVGGLALLFKAFTSTNDGADKFEQMMAGVSATIDILRDRFLKIAGAITKFMSGDFKGAMADGKAAVAGFGAEVEKEFKLAAKATEELQLVEDAMRSLGETRAKLNRDLAAAKEIITDENATYAEKKKAIDAVREAEGQQTEQELANARRKLAAILLQNSLSDTSDEDLKKASDAQIAVYNLEQESANNRRAINKADKRADSEETARLKALAAERAANRKEAYDKEAEKIATRKALEQKLAEEDRVRIAEGQKVLKEQQAEKEQKEIEAEDYRLEQRAKKIAEDKVIAEAMLQQERDIQDAKLNIAQQGIRLIAGIFGKSKAIQKAAIIAENAVGIGKMIIANNLANIGALATPQAIASSGASAVPVIAMNNISTGIGVASSIAATVKALSSLGGGGAGSGANNSGGSRANSGASATPQVNFQASKENQIGNTMAGKINEQAPIRVTVLENDITKVQAGVQAKVVSNSF
jgi:hypothetical protein